MDEPVIVVKQLSPDEQREQNQDIINQTGSFWRIIRIIRDNKDLGFLGCSVIILLTLGFIFCRLYLAMSMKEIQIGISDLIFFLSFIIAGICSIIGQLVTAKGTLSSRWSGKIEVQADIYGNTLRQKRNQ